MSQTVMERAMKRTCSKTDARIMLGLQSYDHRIWDAMMKWGWIVKKGAGAYVLEDVEAVFRRYGSGADLRTEVNRRLAEEAVR